MKVQSIVRIGSVAAVAVLAASSLSSAAMVTLASQGFEGTSADNYGYAFSSTGTNATAAVRTSASSFPTSSMVASGTHGFLSYYVTTTTMLFDKVNLTGTTAAQVGFRLAALATSATNGLDQPDSVKVYLSTGTGSFATSPASGIFSSTPDLTVTGNGNANWSFATGAGVATNFVPTVTTFTPASANSSGIPRTTDGYSTLLLNLPSNATYFFMKVVFDDDSTTEGWAADDFKVTATAVPEPALLGMAAIGGMLTLARRRRLAR